MGKKKALRLVETSPDPHARPSVLEIHLLGRFRVSVDGIEVEESRWTRRRTKMLLKLLALSPQHQLHQEQVMESLWPDASPELSANNLNKVVHMARHTLEPALASGTDSRFITRRSGQILLSAPEELRIDVELFEKKAALAVAGNEPELYEEALSIYRGEFLPEDLYEDWSWSRREQLNSVYLDLLWKVAQIRSAGGQYQACIDRLNQLVAAQPAHEKAHRQLMRSHASLGHREQALKQFQRCQEAVRRELDLEPEEETVELHDAIASGRFKKVRQREESYPKRDTDETLASLAVLPLHNESRDTELEYMCEGIAESLIRGLSRLPGLRVMALSTVRRYGQLQVDPQIVGRELAVQAVLIGRVVQWSKRLIVGVELVRVSDGSLMWGERYDRESTDIFEVQEKISREISEKLRLRLTRSEIEGLSKRHTESAPAYRLYLNGRHFWNKRTAEGLRKAIGLFEQTIDVDPSYSLAYSGLSDSYNLLSLYSRVPPRETMPLAKSAAMRALELDDRLAEAHTSLAYSLLYYDRDWEGAQSAFERAFDLNPNYATAHHWYHEYLTALGRFGEQRLAIRRAAELDPLSVIIKTEFGWGFYYSREYDRAIKHLERTLQMHPGFPVAHLILGLVHLQKGNFQQAVVETEKAIALVPQNTFPLALGILGHAYGAAGKEDEARRVMDQLEILSKRGYVSAYVGALVQMGLRDVPAALQSLETALEEHDDRVIFLGVEPLFDGLRKEASFQRLIRRIGLPGTLSTP